MYQVIDQDDMVYLESNSLLDIIGQFADMLDIIKFHADIDWINPSKVKVNWLYPDRVSDIIQIVKII